MMAVNLIFEVGAEMKLWIGAAVLALAMGGCGQSEPEESAAPGKPPASAAAATAEPTASAAAKTTPAAGASPVLADGRHAVYLTEVDTAGGTVTFDLIEFLTGEAAQKEWKKQHPENPDGPDNDYMIVNENPKLRTLPVAEGAKGKVLSTLGGVDTETIGFSELPALLKKQGKEAEPTAPHISVLPFWLTVKDGSVAGFEEQFLP